MKRITNILFLSYLVTILLFPSGLSAGEVIYLKTETGESIELYKGSYALVIGNRAYDPRDWSLLKNAVDDAKEVTKALKKHGFEVTLEKDLTSAEFNTVFHEFFNKFGKEEKNRILFYYSGHGYAKPNAWNPKSKIGYLVMTDTPDPDKDPGGFEANSFKSDDIVKFAEANVSAHHILFMFDSCFSGTVFETRDKPVPTAYIRDVVAHPVRQFISAGGADETVPDNSEFKKVFLSLLNGNYPEAYIDG